MISSIGWLIWNQQSVQLEADCKDCQFLRELVPVEGVVVFPRVLLASKNREQ